MFERVDKFKIRTVPKSRALKIHHISASEKYSSKVLFALLNCFCILAAVILPLR